jgi:hypothetical protein
VAVGTVAAVALALTGVSVAGVFSASGAETPRSQGSLPGPASHQTPSASATSPSPGSSHSQQAGSTGHIRPGFTSCRDVAHIGDSTSVGMVDPAFLPDASQRLAARYGDVGIKHSHIDASGGRSVVEKLPGQANGYEVATSLDSDGYHGCWVIALGTNDTANVAVGSSVGRMGRINEMMRAAHGQPVMWVNLKTLNSSGPWSQADMQLWNSTLLQACSKYPNLRVFDWNAVAQGGWFAPDGIHYSSEGYAARAKLIAQALAKAFPSGGSSHGCVVNLAPAGTVPG